MLSYFLDSSALVKGYRRETGSERVNDLLRGVDSLIISHLEVSATIALCLARENAEVGHSQSAG